MSQRIKCCLLLSAALVFNQAVRDQGDAGVYYHYFGATPDSWIGPLWPRGRAFENDLSTAFTKRS